MIKKKLQPTLEERQLGLDPNKYAKDPWNPEKYIGKSPLGKIVEDMRKPEMMDTKVEGLEDDQSMTSEEIQSILKAEDEDKQRQLLRYLEQKPAHPLPKKRSVWK